METMAISIVILTFNEEDNIEKCLKALAWCDDIWVVDSFSSDATASIAKVNGAKVVQQHWLGFAGQRNFALDHLPLVHDWVLHLDADECVTPKLALALARVAEGLSVSGEFTAFEIPFRMLFMGRWLRHGGTYPNFQVRFGRRDALRFVQIGHGQREKLARGQLGRLDECLYHFNFSKGIGSWISKHATYSRDEAALAQKKDDEAVAFSEGLAFETRLRRKIKYWTLRIPARPLFRFCYMYFLRLGFLDGKPGLHYCLLVGIYDYFIMLQQRELRFGRDSFQQEKLLK